MLSDHSILRSNIASVIDFYSVSLHLVGGIPIQLFLSFYYIMTSLGDESINGSINVNKIVSLTKDITNYQEYDIWRRCQDVDNVLIIFF